MLPSHEYVSHILPTHLGYPTAKNRAGTWTTAVYQHMSVSHPFFTVPRQCMEYGINHQRVTITYTTSETTADLTWETGSHDFVVGDWINLRGHGGVSTAPNGYYKVSAVTDSTNLTIEVPDTFAFTADDPGHVEEDLLYGYNFLLLDGQTSVTNDLASAKNGGTWTPGGSVALTTATQKFGTSCIDFNATGKYLKLASMAMSNNVGEFTVDAWVYPTGTGTGARTIFQWNNGPIFNYDFSTNKIGWYQNSTQQLTAGTALTVGAWNHVAVTRKLGVITLFVNGVKQVSTWSGSNGSYDDRDVYIGGSTGANTNFPGYIQNMRVSQGLVRWTADFTAPNFQPKDRPGIGYFVSRGGNVWRTATDVSGYVAGLPSYAAVVNGWVCRTAALEDEYGTDTPYINLTIKNPLVSTTPIHAIALDIQNFIAPVNTLGVYRAALSTDTAASDVDWVFAFAFSNVGAYVYVARDTTNPMVRSAVAYVGLGNNRNMPDTLAGSNELYWRFMLYGWGSAYFWLSYTNSANTLADNTTFLDASQYNTGGLLNVGNVAPSNTAETAIGNSSSSFCKAISPVSASALVLGAQGSTVDLMSKNTVVTLSTLYDVIAATRVPSLYNRAGAVFSPGMLLTAPGSVWTNMKLVLDTPVFTCATPRFVKTGANGVLRNAWYLQGLFVKGVLSLDPSDWESY